MTNTIGTLLLFTIIFSVRFAILFKTCQVEMKTLLKPHLLNSKIGHIDSSILGLAKLVVLGEIQSLQSYRYNYDVKITNATNIAVKNELTFISVG